METYANPKEMMVASYRPNVECYDFDSSVILLTGALARMFARDLGLYSFPSRHDVGMEVVVCSRDVAS
jgi:hypothetical protein